MKKISNSTIKENFHNYLTTKCGLKHSSALAYIRALNYISDVLNFNEVIQDSIYDIRNIHKLMEVKGAATKLDEYNALNDEFHGNCGFSFNHYYDFAAQDSAFSNKWDNRIR